MDRKVALIMADGCEEGEALTIADILRRAEIQCDLVGLESEVVTGAHDIIVRADSTMNKSLKDYDMVVLPGGYGGAEKMRDSKELISILQEMNNAGKWIAAICAAPIVLERAGILNGITFTCYPTTANAICDGEWKDEIVVRTGNIITSEGPATGYAFAYKLVEILGGNANAIKERMVYYNAFDEDGQHAACEPAVTDHVIRNIEKPKAAVLMAEGYEESETVQIVDLLRRSGMICDTFRFQEDEYVFSMQKMYVKSDKVFSDEIKDYDILIVPGGRTAGAKLIANESVTRMLQYFDENNKLIAGMCSGTTVLHAAGVLAKKTVTGYTGYADKLVGANFVEDVAVFDRSGVMVAASIWSLIIPAMEQTKKLGKFAFIPACVGFWLGTAFLLLLDSTIPHAEGPRSDFKIFLQPVSLYRQCRIF